MKRKEILAWLREEAPQRLEALWRLADDARRGGVGDEVHLRGLLEISNHCVRDCFYCGLRKSHKALQRYRMTADEVIVGARQAAAFGYGTVVLQSGEDYGMRAGWLEGVIRRIKRETPLAVTLGLGERPLADLVMWRKASADRYLLRFETSNRALYDRLHPPLPGRRSDRLAMLKRLRKVGYEIGGGVMIGIPGQTYDDLADDIELFRELDLDMIGVGPYLAHPATPLGGEARQFLAAPGEQAPGTELMTYKMMALARLVCPQANIPATTALATLNRGGRALGLARGANVVMPNLTPPAYRRLYEIYPGKACIAETAEACRACLEKQILKLGRKIGTGTGGSPRYARPTKARTEGR
jgi:biotin synthase